MTSAPAGPPERPPRRGRPRRRRSSFRINGRGWVYLVLAASVAFAAAFKDNNLLFAVFSLLMGLFAACGWLTWIGARGLEISRALPESVHAGDLFLVGLRIRNARRFWPAAGLRLEDRLSHEGRPAGAPPPPVWLPAISPGASASAAYSLSIAERGWARLGPLTVVSEFPPGLFTCRKVVPLEDAILVYPRLGVLHRRPASRLFARLSSVTATPAAARRGNEDFAGLREYRPGDSPRHIDWKRSARLPRALLVREYEDVQTRDAAILLETFLPDAQDPRRRGRLERAVSFAATLADALLAERYRVRFRACGPEPFTLLLEPRPGALEDLLHALATLKPSRVLRLTDLVRDEPPGTDEVYFLLRLTSEPLPPWEGAARAIELGPQDMRNLMTFA